MPPDGRPQTAGTFVISLDFELHWGMRDHKTVDQYRDNLVGARRAIPVLLDTFAEYDIHATWATVGFLFFSRRSDLLRALPTERPKYTDPRLSPYEHIDVIGEDENEDPFHFARSLLEQIRSRESQEIATHTFSHYYCLEPIQCLSAFRADLRAAMTTAADFGIDLKSIVFPRNQYDEAHLQACRDIGIVAFRGNPHSWVYRPRPGAQETHLVRATRLLDSYCNLVSHHCYPLTRAADGLLMDVRASHFLRPWRTRTSAALQERRVKGDLTHAAQRGLAYHLWWHPHNFGARLEQNIGMLRRILDHFHRLRERYGIRSRNMAESALNQLEDYGGEFAENRVAGQTR